MLLKIKNLEMKEIITNPVFLTISAIIALVAFIAIMAMVSTFFHEKNHPKGKNKH